MNICWVCLPDCRYSSTQNLLIAGIIPTLGPISSGATVLRDNTGIDTIHQHRWYCVTTPMPAQVASLPEFANRGWTVDMQRAPLNYTAIRMLPNALHGTRPDAAGVRHAPSLVRPSAADCRAVCAACPAYRTERNALTPGAARRLPRRRSAPHLRRKSRCPGLGVPGERA
jgi:hypothetical protein